MFQDDHTVHIGLVYLEIQFMQSVPFFLPFHINTKKNADKILFSSLLYILKKTTTTTTKKNVQQIYFHHFTLDCFHLHIG